MTAKDFISILTIDLQESNPNEKFWDDPQLLIKLQRAYKKVQEDIPYFISKENLVIEEGITRYYLKHKAIETVSLEAGITFFIYCEEDRLFQYKGLNYYTLDRNKLYLAKELNKDEEVVISYKYAKTIETINDEVELPARYDEALRLLTLSYIHEKSKGNSKERDLSVHYLKRYNSEVLNIKRKRKRVKNIRSNYQKV